MSSLESRRGRVKGDSGGRMALFDHSIKILVQVGSLIPAQSNEI